MVSILKASKDLKQKRKRLLKVTTLQEERILPLVF
jgi:hypothetical protein